jgi:hypothetical protein
MLKIILAILITVSLIVLAVIVYFKSYYTWIPAIVDNPLNKGKIDSVRSLKPIVPKGYDKGFGSADPFFVNGYVFAEIMKKGKGIIAVAKVDSQDRTLDFIPVLEENFHLSYPFVFNHLGTWYMIPEAYQSGSILLYSTKNFPYDWEPLGEIINIDGVDSTPFKLNGKWYMFTTSEKTLCNTILTTENFPFGPWKIEVSNQLPKGYRGGGQAFYSCGEVLLPLQPPTTILHSYGWKIELYKVNNDLTMEKFTTFYPPKGAGGIHHISFDPVTRQCMVDLRRYLKK